jgi:hypothetical protein
MTKNFTKLIVLCLIAGFSFSACKKSSDNKPTTSDTYSMKLTLNGKAVTYTTCAAADITANGIAQFNIIGTNKGNEGLAIGVIADLSKVKAGQVFKAATAYVQPNSMTMFYTDAANNDYSTQLTDPTGSITITSVSSTTIKGTFSGKLYDFDDTAATDLKYTITDGTFVAQMPK